MGNLAVQRATGGPIPSAPDRSWIEVLASTASVQLSPMYDREVARTNRAFERRDRREAAGGEVVAGRITQRELEVLHVLAAGASNKQIAARLCLSVNTVEKHIGKIMNKLDAECRVEAVGKAEKLGLMSRHGLEADNGLLVRPWARRASLALDPERPLQPDRSDEPLPVSRQLVQKQDQEPAVQVVEKRD